MGSSRVRVGEAGVKEGVAHLSPRQERFLTLVFPPTLAYYKLECTVLFLVLILRHLSQLSWSKSYLLVHSAAIFFPLR